MWRVWVMRGGFIGYWWGNRKEKDHSGRPRRRWVNIIRMDLQDVGCGYMDWIRLAQDRDRWRTLLSAATNLRVSWKTGNFLTGCKQVSFSRRTLHHEVSKYRKSLTLLTRIYELNSLTIYEYLFFEWNIYIYYVNHTVLRSLLMGICKFILGFYTFLL